MPEQHRNLPPLARSYLYVPGDRPERFAKAAASGADAVVLDLEDGVAPAAKQAARVAVGQHDRSAGPQWWVRVDPHHLEADLAVAVRPGTTGLFVPSAEAGLLAHVDARLTEHEAASGLSQGALAVIGLIETPAALVHLMQLCASPRLLRLGIGEADLAAALGMVPDADRRELWSLRTDVVVASAATGLSAPVGPVETRIGDLGALGESTARLVRQGFGARTALHPAQIDPLHAALAPATAELEAASAVVASFERARAEGSGVSVTEDGRLVDLAVVRSARAVLARARH